MTFGKYKGKKVKNVKANYLIWVYSTFRSIDPKLKEYIENNLESLKEKADQQEAEFMREVCDGEMCVPH